jgi:hypothetical protein
LQQGAGAQCSRIALAGFRGFNDVSCENIASALSMFRFCKRRATGFHGSPRGLKGRDKDAELRLAKMPFLCKFCDVLQHRSRLSSKATGNVTEQVNNTERPPRFP